MKKILFLCGKNRIRSPTAEDVFAGRPGIEVRSAGLDHDADHRCSTEDVDWADIIFVMEKAHKSKLSRDFKAHLKAKVICLNIPDDYKYMEQSLIERLFKSAERHLP